MMGRLKEIEAERNMEGGCLRTSRGDLNLLAVCISITILTTLSQFCLLVMTSEYLMHAAVHHFPFVSLMQTVRQNILLPQTTKRVSCFPKSVII